MQIKNLHYYNRYLKFIADRKSRTIEYGPFSGTEKHHILPRSYGGSDDPDNLIILTEREHYVAHWILAYAVGGKMSSAFLLMQNVVSKSIKTSRAYKLSREKNLFSLKGIIYVKRADGSSNDNIQMLNTDPRYLSGEHLQCHVGTKRSEKAVKRMTARNGVRGKTPYFNKITNEILFLMNPIQHRMNISKEYPTI